MKKHLFLLSSLFITLTFFTSVSSGDMFSGTWCIGDERLILTFKSTDSLFVSSLRDETIQGKGTYQKNDSTFIATMQNNDLELKMGFRYKKHDKNTLKAKITYFTVDGDSVNHPRRWMRMERCDPDTFKFPEEPKIPQDSSNSSSGK